MKTLTTLTLTYFLTAFASAQQQPQRAQPASLDPFSTRVLPHIVDGGLIRSVLVITNGSASQNAYYEIDFYGNDGSALNLPFSGLGSVNKLTGTLSPNATIFYTTSGDSAPQIQGWAQANYNTDIPVGLSLIIQLADPNTGKFKSETTVSGTSGLISDHFLMPFDNTNGNISAIALVCADSFTAQSVNASVVDTQGNILVSSETITMAPMNHQAFILADRWPSLAGQQGTLLLDPIGDYTSMSVFGIRLAFLSQRIHHVVFASI